MKTTRARRRTGGAWIKGALHNMEPGSHLLEKIHHWIEWAAFEIEMLVRQMGTTGIQIIRCLIGAACLWAGCEVQAAEPAPARRGDPAIALFAAGKTNPPSATLILRDKKITDLRATLFGVAPSNRVAGIQERFSEAMSKGGPAELAFRKEAQGTLITLDGEGFLGLTPDDIDPSGGASLEHHVTNIVNLLRAVIREEQAERSVRGVITSVVLGVLATGFYFLV